MISFLRRSHQHRTKYSPGEQPPAQRHSQTSARGQAPPRARLSLCEMDTRSVRRACPHMTLHTAKSSPSTIAWSPSALPIHLVGAGGHSVRTHDGRTETGATEARCSHNHVSHSHGAPYTRCIKAHSQHTEDPPSQSTVTREQKAAERAALSGEVESRPPAGLPSRSPELPGPVAVPTPPGTQTHALGARGARSREPTMRTWRPAFQRRRRRG